MTPLERVLLTTMPEDVAVIRSQLVIIARDIANGHRDDGLHITCINTATSRLDSIAGKVKEMTDKMPEAY